MKIRAVAMLAPILALCLGGCGLDTIKEMADDKLEKNAEKRSSYTQEMVNEEVYAGLIAGKKIIEFDGVVSSDMVQQAVYNARYECPEVFWTDGFSVSTGYKSTTLECDSIHDLDEDRIAEMNKELDAAVEEIAAEVDKDLSDHDKLLYLHDRLIELCDYDYDSYSSGDSEVIGFAGSAYGCLVERKAFCEGYAKAFKLLANRLGYECGMVCGQSRGDNHAWNYVKADGEYYWIDVTWDENATETDTDFPPMHKYFLLNDELFMQGRTVDDDVPFVPQCSSMEDNFYVYGGLYLDSYSFEELDSLMDAHADEGGLDMMFSNSESYEAAVEEFMTQGEIWNTHIMQNGGEPLPYYVDPDLRTLTIGWRS